MRSSSLNYRSLTTTQKKTAIVWQFKDKSPTTLPNSYKNCKFA